MSFQTAFDYFTTSADIPAGIGLAWTNLGNCLASAGSTDNQFASSSLQHSLSVRTPLSVSDIPGGVPFFAGVEILGINIEVLVQNRWNGATGTVYMDRIKLGNADLDRVTFRPSTDDAITQYIDLGGTLAELGMTQQDAEDFADGTTDFQLSYDTLFIANGQLTVKIYGIQAQFIYNYTGGGGEAVGVQIPRLF
jgi:hypothetical protein